MATRTRKTVAKKPTLRHPKRSLNTLIAEMSKNPKLAEQVIANPRKFQKTFNLSDSATQKIKGLYLEDFRGLKVKDPASFAAGASIAGQISDFTMEDIGCYYGG